MSHPMKNETIAQQLNALSQSQLADFVLSRFDANLNLIGAEPNLTGCSQPGLMPDALAEMPAGHRRRLVLECPCCCRQSFSDGGHFYFDLRSRRRGFIHSACFEQIYEDLKLDVADDLEDTDSLDNLVALTIDGPGLVGPVCRLTTHGFDTDGELVGSEEIDIDGQSSLIELLSMMTGRPLDEAYRELILVSRVVLNAKDQLTDDACRNFALRRRQIARELRDAGLF